MNKITKFALIVFTSIILAGCARNTENHSYHRVDCDAIVNIYSYGLIDGNNTVNGLKRRVVAVSKHWDKKTYRIRDVNIVGMVSQQHIAIYECRSGGEYVDMVTLNEGKKDAE